MKMPLTSHEMIGIGSGANPKEAITKDWGGYLWQILLFPQATVCLPAEAFHPEKSHEDRKYHLLLPFFSKYLTR